jgi:hypothetical protein
MLDLDYNAERVQRVRWAKVGPYLWTRRSRCSTMDFWHGRGTAAVWQRCGVRLTPASSIWIVDPSGHEPLRKLGALPITVHPRGITWTPDGSGVVITEQESISDIVMFDVER